MLRLKRTKIVIEVLSSEDQNPQDMDIQHIIDESTNGGFSMMTSHEGSEILEGEAAIAACKAQGTDPEFFNEEEDWTREYGEERDHESYS